MGYAGLGHSQNEHQFADAEIAFEKESDDSQTGPVGERFENAEHVGHERFDFL